MKQYIPYLIIAFLSLILGFIIGRRTISDVKETIRVVNDPVSGTVSGLEPVTEEKPVNPDLPVRRDTIYIDRVVYVNEVVDSAAIIAEYELKRQYLVPLFDNQYGKLDISLTSQYNRLSDVSYTFVPIRTIQRIEVRKVWQPFAAASYSTAGLIGIGGGLFYNNLGLEYQYQLSTIENLSNGHLLGLKWKF